MKVYTLAMLASPAVFPAVTVFPAMTVFMYLLMTFHQQVR